mgnify:CR=1 FL=1
MIVVTKLDCNHFLFSSSGRDEFTTFCIHTGTVSCSLCIVLLCSCCTDDDILFSLPRFGE